MMWTEVKLAEEYLLQVKCIGWKNSETKELLVMEGWKCWKFCS